MKIKMKNRCLGKVRRQNAKRPFKQMDRETVKDER
jgi:hypothetical protein